MKPWDIGRKDWAHNEKGQVDYLPCGEPHGTPIPLAEQKYDYKREAYREQAAFNLEYNKSRRPDWKEYERIQAEFN